MGGWGWDSGGPGLPILGSVALGSGALVRWLEVGAILKPVEYLTAAASTTTSTAHTGSLPVAPKQSLAQGEQNWPMTDAERLVRAGPGSGGWERPEKAALWRRLRPRRAHTSVASVFSLLQHQRQHLFSLYNGEI